MAVPLGAAAITAFATAVGAPLANFALQQLKSKLEKTSLADMHKALNDGLEWLLALLKDRDNEVSNNMQNTSNVYEQWKKRVSDIRKEVTSLNNKYEKVKQKKRKFFTRRGLKKTIKRALKEVIEILEKCPKEIVVNLPEWVIEEPGVPSIAEYPTLENAFQDILTLLQDNDVKCVALRGQKGVGKTTIMQHLNNHFYNSVDRLFDMVIFIKLPADERTGDLHILQKIEDRMKMDRDQGDDECGVARKIQRVLVDKRYLLILDGVRRTVNGIWDKLDISRHQKDSKMVITTHYPRAWKSKCVKRKVELKTLSPGEAWKMFQGIVGENLLPDIPIAYQLCKKFCSCLPLLIAPIAKSFTEQESSPDWGRVLNEDMPWPRFKVEGLDEVCSSFLRICYEQLGDRSKQKCFLYASLYPANTKIYTDYFLECCIAQGFLGNVDEDTYTEIRLQGIDKILNHLINAALLEEGEQKRYVKMNYLYRQLALHILSDDSESECKTYIDNEDHREERRLESWQNAKWVSMVGSRRDSLPVANQNYGSLQTLLLQKNLALAQIPLDFFQSMGSLLVLNLYGTKISKLPSLSGLTNLKVFYINGCSDLKIFPNQIQPLKYLEVFDIRDTKADFVPLLNSLKCLRISYIESSNCLGISTLQGLEELTIEVKSLQQWCYHAENIISQVASLENLTFKCHFPSSSKIALKIFQGTREAPIDWVRALIDCTPSPQVGVHGLSPAEARQMFEDIVEAKQALPREGESSSNLRTSSSNWVNGFVKFPLSLSVGSEAKV